MATAPPPAPPPGPPVPPDEPSNRWPWIALGVGALIILLAGTIPVASFVAERRVTHRVRAGRTPVS